ncbi:MAG: hypothetical protein NZ518_01620 [Dehalococcoidia bacterium]|nr:hypothetical protein [Dehalococcoidia bacterium]
MNVVARLTAALLVVATPAAAHEPYSTWKDRDGSSCCGNKDCQPVQPCWIDGRIGMIDEGQCWPLPPEKEIKAPPEVYEHGDTHACFVRRWRSRELLGHVFRCWTHMPRS